MPNLLITGANCGIGLELARQYTAAGWSITATTREPSAELESVGATVEPLDMRDLDAVASFGQRLDSPLDLLIANAGTYGPQAVRSAHDAAGWSETFSVNTIAPFLLAQSVLPHVAESGGKLIAISTKMGSIADNSSGGYIAYRSSKSALNMAWRSLAIDNPSIVAAVLHPGWSRPAWAGATRRLPWNKVLPHCAQLSTGSRRIVPEVSSTLTERRSPGDRAGAIGQPNSLATKLPAIRSGSRAKAPATIRPM